MGMYNSSPPSSSSIAAPHYYYGEDNDSRVCCDTEAKLTYVGGWMNHVSAMAIPAVHDKPCVYSVDSVLLVPGLVEDDHLRQV